MLRTVGKKMKHEVMIPVDEVDVAEIRLKLGRYYGLTRPLNALEIEAALDAYDNRRTWRPYDGFTG